MAAPRQDVTALVLAALGKANPHPLSQTAFVIEGIYADRRDNDIAPLRNLQYRHACALVEALKAQETAGVLEVTLVNDFNEYACGMGPCDPAHDWAAQAARPSPSSEAGRAWKGELFGRVFGMKHARRRALEHLKRLLKARSPLLSCEQSEPELAFVYARTEMGDVLVAAKGNDWRMSARCTAILGWHYHELWSLAAKQFARARSVVLVDFVTPIEKDRTASGAAVAFSLFEAPNGVERMALNCVYFPDEISMQLSTQ